MELRIENMTCGGCAKSVTKAIQSVDPTARVETNPEARADCRPKLPTILEHH